MGSITRSFGGGLEFIEFLVEARRAHVHLAAVNKITLGTVGVCTLDHFVGRGLLVGAFPEEWVFALESVDFGSESLTTRHTALFLFRKSDERSGFEKFIEQQ
jgi:hypothetical protein